MEAKEEAVGLFNNGNKLYKGRLYNEALQQYQLAVEKDLTSYNAHFCVSKTMVRLQQKDGAIAYLKKYFYLIPEEKQSDYLMAFSNILSEENHEKEALELMQHFGVKLKPEHITTYATLLLQTGKIKEVYQQLLSLPNDQAAQVYDKLLQTPQIATEIRTQFSEQNVLPQCASLENQMGILGQSTSPGDAFSKKLSSYQNEIKELKAIFPVDIKSRLVQMQHGLNELKEMLLTDAEKQMDSGNKDMVKTRLQQLHSLNYKDERIQKMENTLTVVKQEKRNKTMKMAIMIGSFIAFLLLGYFGYGYYNKKKIKEKQRIEQLEKEIQDLDEQIELGSFTEVSTYGYVSTTQANMRQGPSDDYPVLMTLNSGTELFVISRNDKTGWYKVKLDSGTEGFMSYKVLTLYGTDDY